MQGVAGSIGWRHGPGLEYAVRPALVGNPMAQATSGGFPPEAMGFFRDLAANNDREWFNANKRIYETAVRGPGEAIIAQLEPLLSELMDPPVAGKAFRIHRDLRFSADKRPYNTHLHAAFFPSRAGPSNRHARPGFFLGLDTRGVTLGGGVFGLEGAGLDAYRQAVAYDGAPMPMQIDRLVGLGFRLDEPELKRTPAGFAADHPRSDLLRRKSLTLWTDLREPDQIGAGLLGECRRTFGQLAPLNQDLADLLSNRNL
jgi:uncharacterized protein (TIGR02453 family)